MKQKWNKIDTNLSGIQHMNYIKQYNEYTILAKFHDMKFCKMRDPRSFEEFELILKYKVTAEIIHFNIKKLG